MRAWLPVAALLPLIGCREERSNQAQGEQRRDDSMQLEPATPAPSAAPIPSDTSSLNDEAYKTGVTPHADTPDKTGVVQTTHVTDPLPSPTL